MAVCLLSASEEVWEWTFESITLLKEPGDDSFNHRVGLAVLVMTPEVVRELTHRRMEGPVRSPHC